VYSAANIDVPSEVVNVVKSKIFRFLWKNKREKIKREGLYQDYEKGGLRTVDFETMIKALRLAWISRCLHVPVHFFSKLGGLNFSLTCNYDVKYCEKLTAFFQRHTIFFLHPQVPL